MDYIKLRSKQVQEQKFQQKTTIFNIRIINTPLNYDLYYYPRLNMLVRSDYQKFHFYTIQENMIQKRDTNFKYIYLKDTQYYERVLFLENFIIINRINQIIRYNIGNLSECQFFKSSLTPLIHVSGQLNKKSFMQTEWSQNRIRIYLIRNIKQSHTLLTKQKIISTKYQNHIIQAITNKQYLYYFNIKMTKQIRKYRGYKEYEPIFNSIYLLVPFYERIQRKKKLIHINIYDISSMKIKGIIETKNRENQIYDSFIFVKDFNIIAIMYSNKLDLFDFNTLKCVGSENIDKGYEQNMQYDQENGLTIFLKRNYRIQE